MPSDDEAAASQEKMQQARETAQQLFQLQVLRDLNAFEMISILAIL